jgi:hypothetical protein
VITPVRKGPSDSSPTPRRWTFLVALSTVTSLGLAFRLPSVLANHPIGFDDGVYLSSVQAMRLGHKPFSEIFSSQGPLFLPILRLFDLLGGEAYWAPRVPMAVAGAVLAVLATVAVWRWRGPLAGWTAGLVVALSGSAFSASSAVEAEGITACFALGAVLVAFSPRFGRYRAVLAGVLVGVALSIKSLFVVPAALAISWVVWRRSTFWQVLLSAGAGVAIPILSFLWWGPRDVWDQYVAFHLDAVGQREPVRNLLAIGFRAMIYDTAAVAVAVTAFVLAVRARRSKDRDSIVIRDPNDNPALVLQGLGIWTIFTAVVLLFQAPLFPRHSVFLLIPAVLLVMAVVPARTWIPIVAIAGAAVSLFFSSWIPLADPVQEEAIAALTRIETHGAIVTDEPGLAYFASLPIPPNLVDPSTVRIEAGYLSKDEVLDGLNAADTCALLSWSGRFESLGIDEKSAAGYEVTRTFGANRFLSVRDSCA